MDQAVAALEAGDYATAYTRALACQALLSVKPDTSFSDEELTFDREAIANFVSQMERLRRGQSASADITQLPVRRRQSYRGFDSDATDATYYP